MHGWGYGVIVNISNKDNSKGKKIISSAIYQGKDQDWEAGQTIYWFDVNGEVFGVVEGDGEGIVDIHSLYISGREDEYELTMILESAVTDEMRAD